MPWLSLPIEAGDAIPLQLRPPFERAREKELLSGFGQAGLLSEGDWKGSSEETVRSVLCELLPEAEQGDGLPVEVGLRFERELWRLSLSLEWQQRPIGDFLMKLEESVPGLGRLVKSALVTGFGCSLGCFGPASARNDFYYRYWDGQDTREKAIKELRAYDNAFNEEDVPTLEGFFGKDVPGWAFESVEDPEELLRSLLEKNPSSRFRSLIEHCGLILKQVDEMEPFAPPVECPIDYAEEDTLPALIFSWKQDDNIAQICGESMEDAYNSGAMCDESWYCHFDAKNKEWLYYVFDRTKRILQLARQSEALLMKVEGI